MKPGVYPGLPMRDYLAIEAVSAGILHELVTRCPRAAWHRGFLNPRRPLEATTPAQGIGTVTHQALLEGSLECVQVIQPHLYPNKTGGGIPAGWTNPAIREARDAAIAAGKVPLLPGEVEPIEAAVDTARAYIDSLRADEPAVWAALQPDGGESEVTLVWEERDGTLCKARPDRLSRDRAVIVDYKTTTASAEPDTWMRRQAVPLGYPMSDAFYRRGAETLFGRRPAYLFLVGEQEAPYLHSLVGLDPAGQDYAARRCERALATWASCLASGRWPGYPTRVAYPEIPVWEVAREGEQEAGGIEQSADAMGREHRLARDFVNSLPD